MGGSDVEIVVGGRNVEGQGRIGEIVVKHTECVEQGEIVVGTIVVGKIVVGSGSHHD